jgi:stress response protein YsnF
MATSDDRAITRSEEEISGFETRVRTVGRVRLRKRIVEEYVNVRVKLRREELVVYEDELPGDGDSEPGSLSRDEDSLELILYAEVPVINTRVEPRERVRVHLDIVTEDRPVTAELRREVVDLEHDDPRW